jgi:uncharacterized membrane protein
VTVGPAPRGGLALTAAAAAVFVAGIFLAPRWAALDAVYAPLCHRLPSRSLDLGFGPTAVCSRCTGLYAGGALALAACAVAGWTRLRLRRGVVALAVAPTVLDVGVRLAGGEGLPDVLRCATGGLTGFAVGTLLAEGIADLSSLPVERVPRRAEPPVRAEGLAEIADA